MEKQKFSSSVATVCTITLATIGLASCTSVENKSAAQLKSVQTVAPLTDTANAAVPAGQATPVAVADASAVTSAPLDPASVVLQKTGRVATPAATTAAAVVPAASAVAAAAPATSTVLAPVELASATPAIAGAQPGVEYYVIPGHVVIPTPRPGTQFVASVAETTGATPLQQMAALNVAAQPQPVATSTKLGQPLSLESAPAPMEQPVLLASAQNDPQFYIVPGRVAIPQPRPDSALAYAATAPGSAAEAIAMQSPNVQAQTEIAGLAPQAPAAATPEEPAKPRSFLNDLIFKYSMLYGVPEHFVHRVAKRESTYNPKAYRAGNYGLMQIRLNTAKGLGYKGDAKGLLDAETNLKYAVKYLRGAWLVADGNEDRADKLYIKGFYYEAKKKGLLEETNMQ